jgi:micrococcal nuclease
VILDLSIALIAVRRSTYRYRRDHRTIVLGMMCLGFAFWRLSEVNVVQRGPERLDEGFHHVEAILGGDLLLLTSGARVRLQAIDVPDSVSMAAKQFLQERISVAARRIRLTFGLERQDDHGHFLAFVWDGESMLNEELVRAGLAQARLEYRSSGSKLRRFAAAQDEARRIGRGIWSSNMVSSNGL